MSTEMTIDGRALPPRSEMYRALTERDPAYEGLFWTGVRTTGVFCRPGCPARTPRLENVEFFPSPTEALRAGYRPCQRCRPLEPAGEAPPWLRPLLDRVEADPTRRWTDADLRADGVDPVRARRWFRRHHGMTFHELCRSRRLGLAHGRVASGADVTGTAFDSGYESLSGFREAFGRLFGDAPGRSRGRPLALACRLLTPLGPMVGMATDEGICLLEFADRGTLEAHGRRLQRHLGCAIAPGASPHLAALDRDLRAYFAGSLQRFDVPVHVHGTDFQRAAWEALCEIPFGETTTYEAVARRLGKPTAARAVGRAVGQNPVAIAIPCHRVVGSDGRLTGYGGGLWRKRYLLDLETHRTGATTAPPQPYALPRGR